MILLWLTFPDISFQQKEQGCPRSALPVEGLLSVLPRKLTFPATTPNPRPSSLLFTFRCQLEAYP